MKAKAKVAKVQRISVMPTSRSLPGLAATMYAELDALRRGDADVARARTVAAMANALARIVEVQIKCRNYATAVRKQAGTELIGA